MTSRALTHLFSLLLLATVLSRAFGAERGLLREVYYGANGTIATLKALPTWPNNPDETNIIREFEAPIDVAERYGQRVRGYVVPPATGNYTFWISSDDNSELWLSTDQSPANIRQIAAVPEWTASREWDKYPAQRSAPVPLVTGKAYYIEALMAEGGGGDNLAVMWQLPSGVFEEPIPETRLVPWGATLGPPQISQQPASLTAVENSTATFQVRVGNVDAMTYQWFRNNSPVPNATSDTLVVDPVRMSDNGAQFYARISNSAGATNTATATLTVTPDQVRPTVVGIANLGTNQVRVIFSEAISASSGGAAGNYALSGGITVQSAQLSADGRSVLLTTSPFVYGPDYTVTINNLTDLAAAPNTIAPNTTATFTSRPFIQADVGGPLPASSVSYPGGGIALSVGGAGVAGASDQFGLQYIQLSGDFDYQVRVQSLSAADAWTQAGLMVRTSLAANSAFFAASATPSISGVSWKGRSASGGVISEGGRFRANYPDTWLRVRRVAGTFTAYASVDGESWVTLGVSTITSAPSTMLVGMFAASAQQGAATTAVFQDFGVASGGSFVQSISFPAEPIGPSSRRTGLVLSEIMYHPRDRADGRNTEFIEIFNSQAIPEDVSNYRIAGEVSFVFPANTVIPGGGFIVVAKDPEALAAVHGHLPAPVVGPYQGDLPNGSGAVLLLNRIGAILQETEYRDEAPWPVAADGAGHSLVLARPSYGEGTFKAWGASVRIGGSPGMVDGYAPSPLGAIVINEFLANSEAPMLDFIELFNTSGAPVDISGAILTDSPNSAKFVIPPGTVLGARSHIHFREDALGFGLSSGGERILLLDPLQTRVVDAVSYIGQAPGQSFGRVPSGGPSWKTLSAITDGVPNSTALREDIVISEIMYNPISRDDDDEFVELHNRGSASVDLGGWQFTSGIDFTFPAGAAIPAGGFVMVAKKAARLLTNYPGLNAANVFGDYSGALANSGERLALARVIAEKAPNPSGQTVTNFIYVPVDEVIYGEGGRWDGWADGGGSSLELVDLESDNDLAANWRASDETGKSSWVTIQHTGVLDLGQSTANEIHVMTLGGGEMLVDNIQVVSGGQNRVVNGGFESGATGWVIQGNHVRSTVENGGFNSSRSLHIRASSGGDNGANRIERDLSSSIPSGSSATIRAQARWLRGDPFLLLRLKGNWLEASGELPVPRNLGTPGAANSVSAQNLGPAIYDVSHAPILPSANQAVTVTARAHDPQGVTQLQLRWRLDSSGTFNNVTMNDAGTGADRVAGDGLYSATIPGQASGVTVAFYVLGTDGNGATATFPVDPVNREPLVRFGDSMPPGNLPSYKLWMTSANTARWNNREKLSNEPEDGTFVYNDYRVIYNASGRYRGSPWIRPSYGSPTTALAYVFNLPEDDAFLNETELNLDGLEQPGRDNTMQRERMSFWIANQLDIPFSHQRYIHLYVNGQKRGTVFTDSQQPNGDYISSWFPQHDEGDIYKIDDWFEFDDSVNREFNVDATLQNFTTTGGVKKQARYRWSWEKKSLRGIDDDYSSLFDLVDALNSPSQSRPPHSIIDEDEWMRAFATRHIVGDWDGYGYNRGKNTFSFKPDAGLWQMLLWDLDFSLGGGSDGPTTSMFNRIGHDTGLSYIYNDPVFVRAYYRAMLDAVNGPLLAANIDPVMDANYRVFQLNGLSTISAPTAVKSWVQQRRSYLVSQLNNVAANFDVLGNNYSTNRNLVTLAGTAPVSVKTIRINGVAYPVTWTSNTRWQASVPVSQQTNPFVVEGFDLRGAPVAGARDTITVTYTGAIASPVGAVVINEIMYDPAVPNTGFVELHNTSASHSFDLSGWEFSGLSFTLPEGTILGPNSYLVVVSDRVAFEGLHGVTPRIAGEFAGALQNDGELLRLVRPGATPAEDLLVDAVRYSNSAPWPGAASGGGASLQLIDPLQDNFTPANWGAVAGVSTPGAPNSVRATLPAFPNVWINEIIPENRGALRVELYNAGAAAVSLSGLYLANNATSNLQAWPLPATILGAGQFEVVTVDGIVGQAPPNADAVALTRLQSNTPVVLDYVSYQFATTNSSYGSFPDGPGIARRFFYYPTPGAPNNPAAGPVQVFINEWMASNTRTINDPADGAFEDWFELFNAGDMPVDLSGYYLTDNLANKTKYRIPDGVIIPARGFLLAWADENPEQFSLASNTLHADFKLSQSGEAIGLFAPDGTSIDEVTFGQQTSDVSQGRAPDGGPAPFVFMPAPTPGGPNIFAGGNRAPVISLIGDQTVTAGQTLRFQIEVVDPDEGQTLTYTLPGAPAGMGVRGDGEFFWTVPDEQSPGEYSVTVMVTDDGSPPLSASRAFTVTVLAAAPPAIQVSSAFNPATGLLELQWNARAGTTYNVETRPSLSNGAWVVGSQVTATGGSASASIDTRAESRAFYRVSVAP